MSKTIDFFVRGKISLVLDGGAGSSGKCKIGSFLTMHSGGMCKFGVHTFTPNSSHTVIHKDGRKFVYKALGSYAHMMDEIGMEKMYIGHAAALDLDSFFKEIEESGIDSKKIGISPLTSIVQDIDKGFEMGTHNFEGEALVNRGDGTIRTGTTASGSGTVRARKVMRNKKLLLAKDVPKLRKFLCDVSGEILDRLDAGQSGIGEIAQGYQLSYGLPEFYPFTTSRNCTLSSFLDDTMLPPHVVGKVCINYRTFPIRIHSHKYFAKDDGRSLTWDEVQEDKIKYDKIDSYSGDWYDDQEELTWEKLTVDSGSDHEIMECTTLTKLPRRVATFSVQNLINSIRANYSPMGVYLSINFINYVDWEVYKQIRTTPKIKRWLEENIETPIKESKVLKGKNIKVKYLGTSEFTEDTVVFK